MQVFDKFALELKEALKSLSGMIHLEPYRSEFENDARNVMATRSPNNEMINHFEDIFNKWIETIEQYLEDTESEKKDDKEAGPRFELDYWR